MREQKRIYIIISLLISLTTSLGSLFFYERWFEMNKLQDELIKKEEKLEKYDTDIKTREDAIEKSKKDIKLREEELEKQKNDLNIKETQLQEKENELKLKEDKLNERQKQLATSGGRNVYLTFDDGPSENTEKILDVLATNDIDATFFVNAHQGFEKTYSRIVNEGSTLGNHTYSHNYSEVYSSVEAFEQNVDKLNEFLKNIGLTGTNLLRYPGGSNNLVCQKYAEKDIMSKIIARENERGFDYIDWNVSSGDAASNTVEKDTIVKNVIEGCKGKNSPVILFHDSRPKTTTVEALPEIIQYLKNQGYTFKTLEKDRMPKVKFK